MVAAAREVLLLIPDCGSARGVDVGAVGAVARLVFVMLTVLPENLSNQKIMVYLKISEFSRSLRDSVACFRLVKPTPRPTPRATVTSRSTASAIGLRVMSMMLSDESTRDEFETPRLMHIYILAPSDVEGTLAVLV